MNEVLERTYLPFTEEHLLNHFALAGPRGECARNEEHLSYYKKSIKKYHRYLASHPDRVGRSLSEMKAPCQIEKDERFWVTSCLMTVFYDRDRVQKLEVLLTQAYGERPPMTGITSWRECLEGDLALFFETILLSPPSHKAWLREHLQDQQIIPHVLDSAQGKVNLEGPTHADALLLNPNNGFAVIVEAKVLSDISYQITYDVTRNQMARTIDVLLEENSSLCEPVSRRVPERTLFLLLTPEVFKRNLTSRLYGYKFTEYKKNPKVIAADLPHRTGLDWERISPRLGWLIWDDFHSVNRACCSWL